MQTQCSRKLAWFPCHKAYLWEATHTNSRRFLSSCRYGISLRNRLNSWKNLHSSQGWYLTSCWSSRAPMYHGLWPTSAVVLTDCRMGKLRDTRFFWLSLCSITYPLPWNSRRLVGSLCVPFQLSYQDCWLQPDLKCLYANMVGGWTGRNLAEFRKHHLLWSVKERLCCQVLWYSFTWVSIELNWRSTLNTIWLFWW